MASFQLLRERLAALPVHGLIDAVTADVIAGRVTVVAASTGSGKSMILPGSLADVSDHQIVVMTPRRFLAVDAAFNVAELAGVKIGEDVGYALGQMDGESSQHSGATRVLYCTYGYAISSGLINRAQTVVLDEVHEADEQISLARAILRQRKDAEGDLRILEMSATVDADAQARYWHPVTPTAVHKVTGQALACEVLHESPMLAKGKDRRAEEIAIDFLQQGRKGIVLFRPGVREVETSVAVIKGLLIDAKLFDVDVVGIHGGTPSDERRMARRPPDMGRRKIIVGTNVIESGVNLRWLDAGISDGYRKVPYHRDDTGADALVLEDLPQSGLLQQIGRINRDPAATGFASGLFILHAQKPFDLRRPQNGPAMQRQSLNSIAFHAASLGYNPTKLVWDVTSTAHLQALAPRFAQALQELTRLGLVQDDWILSKEGGFIRHLPVGPETGALLSEARFCDEQRMRDKKPARVMRDAVIIAAIAESHGLRKNTRFGHKGDQHRTSDMIDALNAFRAVRKEPLADIVVAVTEIALSAMSDAELATVQQQRRELEAVCLKHNMTLNGFIEVAHLADEISERLTQHDKGVRINQRGEDDNYDAERYGELQRCLLNGHVNQLFQFENDGLRDLLRDVGKARNEAGQPFNGYVLGRNSVVAPLQPGALVVGELREVAVDQAGQLGLLLAVTHASAIPAGVLIDWAMARAARYLPVVTDVTVADGILSGIYAGQARFEIALTPQLHIKAKALAE